VAETRRWLRDALITAVESDQRVAVEDGLALAGKVDGRRVGPLMRHPIESAISSWAEDVLGLVDDVPEPDLGALLVEMVVLGIPGARETLEVLAPLGAEGTIDEAKAGLLVALRGLYGEARDRVAAEVAYDAGERQVVDEARTALTDAAALSAFANA
jgi:hypothetical protein